MWVLPHAQFLRTHCELCGTCMRVKRQETGAHTQAKKHGVNKQGSVFNHPQCVYLAVVRFSLLNLPNSIAKNSFF